MLPITDLSKKKKKKQEKIRYLQFTKKNKNDCCLIVPGLQNVLLCWNVADHRERAEVRRPDFANRLKYVSLTK